MTTDLETKKIEGNSNDSNPVAKPSNPSNVRKAVSLGKEMRKQPDTSKADAARKMYEMISDEPREVIVQAFIDGASLTPKGSQTYFYNCRRRAKKNG